jgi:predicted dehydrogenase
MLERILIVGLGSIGSRHARIARTLLPEAQIGVLRHRRCDDVPAGLDHCFDSLDQAMQFRPQAAVIANPATHHLEPALALGQAGVHLLIEKPIANAAEGVQALIDACQDKASVLMTAYNLRFLPSLQYFRDRLAGGEVGKILSVRAEIGQYLPSWRPGADYRQTVSARAALGGGVLLELSHEIDYLRWLFGDIKWVNAILATQSDLEIDVEDTAHLTLGFAAKNGAKPLIASLSMDFVRHDTTRICVAIGETGTLRWNAIAGTVEVLGAGGTAWQTLFAQPPQRDESYIAEWKHFLDCIAQKAPPLVSGQDGLAALKVIEAARLSSARKTVVDVG